MQIDLYRGIAGLLFSVRKRAWGSLSFTRVPTYALVFLFTCGSTKTGSFSLVQGAPNGPLLHRPEGVR